MSSDRLDTLQARVEALEVKASYSEDLLETLAQDLAAAVHGLDNRIREVSVRIMKLNPPIAYFSGQVGVTYTKVFE